MPFKSQAQRGLFYRKMEEGEFSPEMVKHWEDATPKGKKLPKHVKKHAFAKGFSKTAVIDLSEQARYGAIVGMEDYVPGRGFESKDSGQRKKINTRTFNVRNEGREFNQAIKHDGTSRRPNIPERG